MKDFTDQYVKVLKNYTLFEGRARRTEFWKFVAASLVVGILIGIIDDTLRGLYNLVVLTPSLAVGSRRLHDIGKSGWWQLLFFIPIVGWIILIVFFATDTTPGDNKYGSNPKAGPVPPQPPMPTAAPTPTV